MTTRGDATPDPASEHQEPAPDTPNGPLSRSTPPTAAAVDEAAATRVMPDAPVAPGSTTAAAVVSDRPRLAAGAVLGDYLLAERIGKGGMGEVWKAVHRRLGRTVAIKLTLHAAPEARLRFEREARLASTLDHPHIAKLFEYSLEPSFIAMQYVEGVALHKATGDRIRALRDAALAVHHAHRRGVLHRDLKPDNILVDAQGQAFVLDFGLARPVAESGEALTVTGELIGTPTFMAPEQALGDTAHMDARTDVYGLGATLYALISGHSPFAGPSTWAVLRRVVEEDPLPPGGDRDLETICLTAMAKDPARRYQSAEDFAAELSRFLERRPVLARRAGWAYRLRRSIQRRPAIWGLAAALALAVAIGASFGATQLLASRASLLTAKASLSRAHDADTARLAAAAQRERELQLETLVARTRRELDALDDTLARQLDPAQRGLARARLEALLGSLHDEQRLQPDEGVLAALVGQAELLRNQEDAAIAAFDTAIAHSDSPVSRALDTLATACQGQALAVLRRDYFTQMVRLFVFDDGRGYATAEGVRVQEDLDRSALGTDHYTQQCLALWVRYLDAARSEEPGPAYTAIAQEAASLAAQGGRRPEILNLLCGVLEPFPRPLDAVVADYSAGIDRCHNLPQLYLQRALEYQVHGRYADALADCDRALGLAPDDALAHLLRAKALLASQDPADAATLEAAAADLAAAMRLAPTQPNIALTRAEVRFRQGRFHDAADDFATAQRLVDEMGGSYRNVGGLWFAAGEFHRQLGQHALAIAAYTTAGAAGATAGWVAAARLLEEDGQADAAQQLLAPLLLDAPPPGSDLQRCCAARLWRAGLRERRGDIAGALADDDWTIAHAPNLLSALTDRGDVLRRAGRVSEALPVLDQAVAVMRSWAQQARAGGMPAVQADRHVADALVSRAAAETLSPPAHLQALADCQEALRLVPEHVDGLVLRSSLIRQTGLGDGQADAIAAATLLTRRGDTERARMDFTDALASYAQAAAIHSDDSLRSAQLATQEQRDRAARQVIQP